VLPSSSLIELVFLHQSLQYTLRCVCGLEIRRDMNLKYVCDPVSERREAHRVRGSAKMSFEQYHDLARLVESSMIVFGDMTFRQDFDG
jgi:hypothetical protein